MNTRRSLRQTIPPLPHEVWNHIREKTRGHFEALQQSDVDDDSGRAVKGRHPSPNCKKYPVECLDACENAKSWRRADTIRMSLNMDQVPEFIRSALLFLFDNTYSLVFRTSSTPPSHLPFDRASLQCQMLVLVGKPYIDELLLHVPSLSANDALHITKVYYNHNNETVGSFSEKYIEIHRKRKKINTEWVKYVAYNGFDTEEQPRVELRVVLVDNTFYWLTRHNDVTQKRIEKNDLTFPIENFVFESISCESEHRGDFEILRGDNLVRL